MTLLKIKKIIKRCRLLLILALLVISCVICRRLMAESIAADKTEYEEYVSSMSRSIPEDNYLFVPYGSEGVCLGLESEETGSEICLVLTDAEEEQRIRPVFSRGTYVLKFFGTDLVIDVCDGQYSEDAYIQAASRDNSSQQLWRITEDENGEIFYITSSDEAWALTFDTKTGRVFLSEFTYSDDQKWILQE